MTNSPNSKIDPDFSQFVLNLMTVGTSHSFESVLDACVRHQIGVISPWRDHYAKIGVHAAALALRERGIGVDTLCRITGFGPADNASAWQLALDDARMVIEEAALLGAQSIAITGGGVATTDANIHNARRRILEGVQTLLPEARAAGVRLAIEPLHPMCAADRGAVSNVKLACAMANNAGEGVGVLIDAYNTWWDPELESSIADAAGLICGFQVSDWLVPTTDLAFDRGMMGDGVIDFRGMRKMVTDAGYAGPIEVEILSHRWSALPIDEVIATVKQRLALNC